MYNICVVYIYSLSLANYQLLLFSAATLGGLILKYVPFFTPSKLLMNLHRGIVVHCVKFPVLALIIVTRTPKKKIFAFIKIYGTQKMH